MAVATWYPVTPEQRDPLDALFDGRPETLSVAEVADMLGISTKGVYRWIKDGVIPAYKVGRTWFLLRDDLHELMRRGRNATPGWPGS